MGDLLAGLPPLQVGAGALLGIVILLILTGRLVPQSVAKDALDQRDKALALADKYQAVITEQGMTLHTVLEAVETTNQTLTALQAGMVQATRKGPSR